MSHRSAKVELSIPTPGTTEIEALGLLHDLRSPLSAAANAFRVLDILISQPADEETRFFRDTVRASLRRAWLVVEDWHEALGTDAGARPPGRSDLQHLCDEVARDLGLGRSEVSVRLDACPPIEAPAAALRVVLRNLLSNALRSRRDGVPPRITIGSVPRGRMVELYVRDNGRGMPPRHAERALQPFWRGAQKREPGLGLGLTLVRHVVAQRGGHVRIRSRHGEGTTVSFTLPAARCRRATSREAGASDATPRPRAEAAS